MAFTRTTVLPVASNGASSPAIRAGDILFISAHSGVIDATPACDAYAAPGGPPPNAQCAASQTPGGQDFGNDMNANFTFPSQDIITRQRFFGGFKLKLSVLFVAAQVEFVLGGHTVDGSQPNGARDEAGTQQTYSLSGGFDF